MGPSWIRDGALVSCTGSWILYQWVKKGALKYFCLSSTFAVASKKPYPRSVRWKCQSLSYVDSATPLIVACWPPLSMEFSRPEYWSGLPFPSPEDLPNPGTEPRSPALQADSLPSEPPGKSMLSYRDFIVLCFMAHFELLYFEQSVFVKGIKSVSRFIFMPINGKFQLFLNRLLKGFPLNIFFSFVEI